MQVQVTRRGGLMGIPLSGQVDTSELPADQSRAAERALQKLPDSSAPTPSHPDAFLYELSFGGGRSVAIDESDLTDDLRPLIDAALDRGTLG